MAGRGGDVQAVGPGPGGPGPGEAAAGVAAGTAPAETLRSWDAAEARLFPLIMTRPEEYERSLALIQVLLGWLRSRCQDVPALLAESVRGGAIVTHAAGELSGDLCQGGLCAGGRGELIAAAAGAMRYRELRCEHAAPCRRDACAMASAR